MHPSLSPHVIFRPFQELVVGAHLVTWPQALKIVKRSLLVKLKSRLPTYTVDLDGASRAPPLPAASDGGPTGGPTPSPPPPPPGLFAAMARAHAASSESAPSME